MKLLLFCPPPCLRPQSAAGGGDLPPVDTSVRPGDAFFEYVNGAWLKATEIPADRSTVSDSVVLSDLADRRTREIIQETAQTRTRLPTPRRSPDFYNAFMDEAAIEKLGLAPLEPQLRAIAGIRDRKTLSRSARQSAARRRRCPQQHGSRHRQAA
jgi:predicted metalloendopeptidase